MRSYGTIVSALWPYFFNLDRRPREGIPSAVYGGVNGGATGLRTSVAAADPTEVLCAKYEAACLGRAGLLPDYSRTAAVAERGVERLFFMINTYIDYNSPIFNPISLNHFGSSYSSD